VPGHDLGVVIILITIIIKLILFPLSTKSIKSQKSLQTLQPKITELKEKYKDNKEALGKAMMELYKNNKVNPFSSCLPLIIQFPVLIAVYNVFRKGFGEDQLSLVYSFIHKPEIINTMAFGFLDMSSPNIMLAVLAGLAQFWQVQTLQTKKPEIKTPGSKDENMMAIMNKQMKYFMPAITIFIGISLPGGLTFYWFLVTLLSSLQQIYIFKKIEKKDINDIDKEKAIEV
jgi:YidC/Oxa1 family membrane protein insertase